MANVDISASVPATDIARLVRAMDRLQSAMGYHPSEAVKAGAFAVARALSAATRISPKTRKVIATHSRDKRKAAFAAIKPTKNGDIEIPIRAKNIDEARANKRAKITKSGLCKAVWLHTARKTGGGKFSGKDVSGSSKQAEVIKNLKRDDASIRITNRLGYASLAFKSKGRATLDDAMSRAANGMIKFLERKTKMTASQLGF